MVLLLRDTRRASLRSAIPEPLVELRVAKVGVGLQDTVHMIESQAVVS